MGRFIGAELPKKGSLSLIVAVAFALGFAVTVAEPDVLVLAAQVERASEGALHGQLLIYVIATGVGLFTALGLLRVVKGFSMIALLGGVYAVMILLSLLAPEVFVPLYYQDGRRSRMASACLDLPRSVPSWRCCCSGCCEPSVHARRTRRSIRC
jgi:hypothetical protein